MSAKENIILSKLLVYNVLVPISHVHLADFKKRWLIQWEMLNTGRTHKGNGISVVYTKEP